MKTEQIYQLWSLLVQDIPAMKFDHNLVLQAEGERIIATFYDGSRSLFDLTVDVDDEYEKAYARLSAFSAAVKNVLLLCE